MDKLIAVEEGLKNISNYLAEQGYKVISLDQKQYKNADCVLISGLDKDVMGISTRTIESPVINVKGLSPEEVLEKIKNYS